MPHSLTKIWIHTVFGTKEREPLIHRDLEAPLYDHIKKHLENDFDCRVRIINGIEDHVHILLLLNPNFSVKDILKNIKGESSYWMNRQNLLESPFAWQVGYGAFSVSDRSVKEVERYIFIQKTHHRVKTFLAEYGEFLGNHGLPVPTETAESAPQGHCDQWTHE